MRHIRLLVLPLLLLSFGARADLIGDGIILGGGFCDDSDARTIDALREVPSTVFGPGADRVRIDGCVNARWDIDDGDPNTFESMHPVTGEVVHFDPANLDDRWYEPGPRIEDFLLENAVFPTDQIFSDFVHGPRDGFTLDYEFPDSELLLLLSLNVFPDLPVFDFDESLRLDPLDLTIPQPHLVAAGMDAAGGVVIPIAALLVDASPTVIAADGREFHAGAFGLFNLCYLAPCPVPEPPVSVPEPGTLALLGIGLVGMGLARRRRKV